MNLKRRRPVFKCDRVVSALLGIFLSLWCAGLCFSGTLFYEYDHLNRIIKMEKPGSYVMEYAYDAAGNRTQVIIQIQGPVFDHDMDHDVDGLDLQVFAAGFTGNMEDLAGFAGAFGGDRQ